MKELLSSNWQAILQSEFNKDYFVQLNNYLDEAYAKEEIFPERRNVFNAFNTCGYEAIKVVILGQDPYHGEDQAHGLCFSVQKGVKIPPSLKNIYKELHEDLGCDIPNHGYLQKWADQGVFLLNTVLTVKAHEAASHSKIGWQQFTDAVIQVLNLREDPIIFVLWGNYAISKKKLITNNQHIIIESVHPSPLSARRGFMGSKPFSKINEYLIKMNKSVIDWQIES